jgi:hypothetical protein
MRPCLPPVGRAHPERTFPRARRIGFYHGVGALWSTWLRPFALPVPIP